MSGVAELVQAEGGHLRNSRGDGVTIVAVSDGMRRALALAERFAASDLPILLVGPTGVGKELFARQIHAWSRRSGPLVDVNAAALPREMVESLLFGHRKGAFTGAVESRIGLVQSADRGTLFLDELASLSLEGQAKLLRVVEQGEVRPLGDTANRPVRCRFVAAVQDDIDERLRHGAFRLDLYQRLAGVVVRIPGLQERPDDVVPLARAFAAIHGRTLTSSAELTLLGREWPGNVRELRAVVLRAVFLAGSAEVSEDVMSEALGLRSSVDRDQRHHGTGARSRDATVDACERAGWNLREASRALGISRATIYRRLQLLGVDLGRARRTGDATWLTR